MFFAGGYFIRAGINLNNLAASAGQYPIIKPWTASFNNLLVL
jgi:hypothetical protein